MNTMKLEDIRIRDPYILYQNEVYYLFGSTDKNTWQGEAEGFDYYISLDLKTFKGPYTAFQRNPEFWANMHYWAPEVYARKDYYLMAASFKAENICRGVQILKTNRLDQKFKPIATHAITPSDWECLDGTVYQEKGKDYLIFSHEWMQIGDGEICIAEINSDFSELKGKIITLFRASEAPWTILHSEQGHAGYVTDGPYVFSISDQRLAMIWSSFSETGYAIGIAYSDHGIFGPWIHEEQPLYAEDGGHGMIFRDRNGRLNLIFHSPNELGKERTKILACEIKDEKLEVGTGKRIEI